MTCSKFEAENFIYKQISTTAPLIIENVLSKISSEFNTSTRLCSADLCQVWGRSELRFWQTSTTVSMKEHLPSLCCF